MPRQQPGEPYYRVDSAEAHSMLDSDPDNTVVVDVRRDDEWVTGHASGAIHIPVDDLTARIGEVPQAASMGYEPENLYNIEDGTPYWIAGNHPTSYGDEP